MTISIRNFGFRIFQNSISIIMELTIVTQILLTSLAPSSQWVRVLYTQKNRKSNQNLDRDIVEASLWKPNKNPNNLKQGETLW